MDREQDSLMPLPLEGEKTCWGRIVLNPRISRRNFVAVLVHYAMLSYIFVNADSLQPMLLQYKFHIEKKDQFQSSQNTLLLAFDIAVKVLCAPFMGVLCDRVGRRPVLLYGLVCIAVAMALMPYCGYFWELILLRSFYAQGAIAISVVPLLADYIHPDKKGVASSLSVFMSAIGALTSAEINYSLLKNIQEKDKIYTQYAVAAGVTLAVGLLYCFLMVKAGRDYYSQAQSRNCAKLIQVGRESLRHKELVIGFLASFLARADSILLSLFLILWTYSFTKKDEQDYDQANLRASMLSGITYSVIMVCCMLYGLLFETRKRLSTLMAGMLLLTGVGVGLINFVNDPEDPLIYVALIVLGLGMGGLLTGSLFLVNTYARAEHRGYITGIQTLFGIVGISIQVFVGSLLYSYSRNGPFDLFAAECLLVLIVVAVYGWREQAAPPVISLNDD